MKKKAGGETACLVVDSTVMYQQLISEIHVGRNGYIMIKNDDNLVVMHPEAVQWGIKVVEGRQRIYQGKELDMSSLSELLARSAGRGIRHAGLLLLLVGRPGSAPGA